MTISLYDKLYHTATYSPIRWYILHPTLSSDQICPMHLKYHGQISQDSFLISISFQQSRICCACGKSHGHGQSKMTVVMGNAYCLCIFYAHGNSHAHAHAYSHGHAHDYVHGHVYYWQTCLQGSPDDRHLSLEVGPPERRHQAVSSHWSKPKQGSSAGAATERRICHAFGERSFVNSF